MSAPRVFTALLLLLHQSAFAVSRNPDVKTEVKILGDTISFEFGFRDQNEATAEWDWQDSLSRLDSKAKEFGIPDEGPATFNRPAADLSRYAYVNDPQIGIRPDYGVLAYRYFDSADGLVRLWKAEISEKSLNKRQEIELLLAFLQDFPYGEVPLVWEKRNIAGLFVPPLIFKNGWADCDSKALLMAIVLAHDPALEGKLAMILVPEHAFLGVEIDPTPYDEIYSYENHNYVITEPVGLARTPLGRRNSPYSQVLAVVPISIHEQAERSASVSTGVNSVSFAPQPTWVTGSESQGLKALSEKDCPAGRLLVDLPHPPTLAHVQTCYLMQNGNPIKDGPEVRFGDGGAPVERKNYSMGKAAY